VKPKETKVSKPHVEVTRSAVKPKSSYSVVKQAVPQTTAVHKTTSRTASLPKTTREAAPKVVKDLFGRFLTIFLQTSAKSATVTKESASKKPLTLKETFDLASKKHRNSAC
jgi:hypothetical protein